MNEYFKIFNSFLFGNRSPEDIYKLSEGKIRSMTVDIENCKSENDFYFNLQLIPAPNYKLNYFTKLIKNSKVGYLNFTIQTIQNSLNKDVEAYNYTNFIENEVEYLIQECFATLNKVEKIYDSPLMLQAARNLSTQYSTNDYPNIKDKHFIYEYLYYSLIHIHLELQANFYSLIEDEPKTIDYFKSAFQFEHTPLLNPTITPNQIKSEKRKNDEPIPKIKTKENKGSFLSHTFTYIHLDKNPDAIKLFYESLKNQEFISEDDKSTTYKNFKKFFDGSEIDGIKPIVWRKDASSFAHLIWQLYNNLNLIKDLKQKQWDIAFELFLNNKGQKFSETTRKSTNSATYGEKILKAVNCLKL